MKLIRSFLMVCSGLLVLNSLSLGADSARQDAINRRVAYLEQLRSVLPPERTDTPMATPLDSTWSDWLARTGELPPDFDKMPSIPGLPDPLVWDEGGQHVPITTISQWLRKREWIKKEVQHWITGTIPPAPQNLQVEVLDEQPRGALLERTVLLSFGPNHAAKLHVNLLIPPGEGPFPVFMTQWKKDYSAWVQAAVRRGYIGCRYTATDPKYGYPDDSETYGEIWYPEYDFSTLMRWAWGAQRAVDYLYTLSIVDTQKIALAGLSRNGKQSLMAAAFDDRIDAVIPVSGGTGSENPFRYTSENFDNESIADITTNFPDWLHPRLRFFIGREQKLPVDQNLLMALVAPRGLMVSSSVFENEGNPWGIEQGFLSAKKAYDFLGAGDQIALDLRYGLHPPAARDLERYLDFCDYVFKRTSRWFPNVLYYDYSFSKWMGLSGEQIHPVQFSAKGLDDLLLTSNGQQIRTIKEWEKKKETVQTAIRWGLGDEPPSLAPGSQPDYMRDVIIRPRVHSGIHAAPVGFGTLYYPEEESEASGPQGLPVVMYLHEYAYPTGYGRNFQTLLDDLLSSGFAVYAMDQIGFGTRLDEGRDFYERFPHWSKLGRMVADTRYAIDELQEAGLIDPNQIFVAGYALGGTIGLYSAALDSRIAGVVSVCGFTPMRLDTAEKGTGGIQRYSHLHGLLPRLGFFVGEERKIPYDFHEILACIAPRPLLIIAPSWDRFATLADIQQCISEARSVYRIYSKDQNLDLSVPENYNRFSPAMEQQVIHWLSNQVTSQ